MGQVPKEDAGRDRDALEGVHAVRQWGTRLREIAKQDGIDLPKSVPKRRELFTRYMPETGYPTFSMFSELGAHPGALGNLLFSLRPDSQTIDYSLGGAFVHRAFWCSAAIVHFWQTCGAIAECFGWNDWLTNEAMPIYTGTGSEMMEARRRRALG